MVNLPAYMTFLNMKVLLVVVSVLVIICVFPNETAVVGCQIELIGALAPADGWRMSGAHENKTR